MKTDKNYLFFLKEVENDGSENEKMFSGDEYISIVILYLLILFIANLVYDNIKPNVIHTFQNDTINVTLIHRRFISFRYNPKPTSVIGTMKDGSFSNQPDSVLINLFPIHQRKNPFQ